MARLRAILSTGLLAALSVSCSKPAPETPHEEPAAAPGGGPILHYVRSNRDGSNRADVHVLLQDGPAFDVFTTNEKCAPASLSSAELDESTGQLRRLVSEAIISQDDRKTVAVSTYDSATKMVTVKLTLPGAPLREAQIAIDREPWHPYDFDFATFAAASPAPASMRNGFAFGLTLLVPDPARAEPLIYLGEADAVFREELTRDGRAAWRFALGGPAFGSFGGQMIIDAETGRLLEADTGFPNHPGHEDFKLALQSVDENGGDAAWRALFRAQFEGCESSSPTP